MRLMPHILFHSPERTGVTQARSTVTSLPARVWVNRNGASSVSQAETYPTLGAGFGW
jgi:hypothetical protein